MMSRLLRLVAFSGAVLLSVAALPWPARAAGQIYRWVGDDGTIHYTSEPNTVPEQYRGLVRAIWPSAEPDGRLATSSAQPTVIPFRRGGAIIVTATINGLGPVALLLDTGADRTMVSPTALRRLGVSPRNVGDAIVKGVTGMSQAFLGWIDSLKVGNTSAGPLSVIVHDAELSQADGLLGRDYLSFFTLTIDVNESTVTLRQP
jgi:predicted aspartyl protease